MPLTRNQSNAAAQAKLAAVDSSETSTSKDSVDQGGASAENEPPRRDSPENCSICLGPFNNKSFTSSCAHSFCFVCLKQWSKVKAECPLCKQPFTSIFHNIRSNQQYDIYELPHQPNNQIDYNIFNYAGGVIPSFTGPTHHLFSLSQPAFEFDADLTLSNFSRFQFRHRRYDRYLNPLGIHGEHPYSYSGQAINPTTHISAATWPRGAEEFRREVYRRNLGPPAVILGRENDNYRLTPTMVSASAHRLHRIMPWLTRELKVLLRSHHSVRQAICIIQPLLTQVTIDSMYFYDQIVSIIGHRSRQFVQEFVAFANSALSVQVYDRKAMYRRRESAPAVPSSSSSDSSNSDVVEVTDISPEVYPATSAPGPSQTQPLNLSRSGWDSPTSGPWWSATNVQNVSSQADVIDRVSVSSESDDPVFRPEIRNSDSEHSRAGSDIIFVKYDKPWNERSPINLTSNSEGGEDGTEPARKKKKSKHKKKKKDVIDDVEAGTSKREKSKKSTRSKHRDKSKGSSKALSDEERNSATRSKRHLSQSSTEQHKTKKHKKSKSKKEKLSDREKVDRFFAQAMAEQDREGTNKAEKEEDTSSKRKDKERHGASSSKDKSRKKKKSRKHSKDSHNQSLQHTCKKHHSGHKKSSNRLPLTDDVVGQEHGRAHHRRSPIRANQASASNRLDSNDNPGQVEPSGSSSMSHPVVPGFQPPYLSMADTVQHIPVNLWVSAWPTLSVSHTYPPPPHPIPIGQNLPQGSNTSSSLVSTPANAGPSRYGFDRMSISSDDSSSDSSDSESDDAQDLQIPSLQNVHSRTKQWLETNFPDLGRPQSSSASIPANGSTSSSTVENPPTSVAQVKASVGNMVSHDNPDSSQNVVENYINSKEKQLSIEVVSIPSGDEDVVVCSSDDSCSNVVDLWVIDVDKSNKKADKKKAVHTASNQSATSSSRKEENGVGNISTLPFSGDMNKSQSSGPSHIILPPANKPFQPFKLQKKPAMTSRGIHSLMDPFLTCMTHSSDEDGEVDNILHGAESNNAQFSESATSQYEDSSVVPLTYPEDIAISAVLPSASWENGETSNCGDIMQAQKSHLPISTTSSTSASFSSETSSVFSVLPPLSSSTATTSALSSGIKYLPYSNLTTPTSMCSLLPCYIPPSSMPPPHTPLSLPLSFPFPQIPPLLTNTVQSNPLLRPLYQPQGQHNSSKITVMSQNTNNTQIVQNVVNESGDCDLLLPKKQDERENGTVSAIGEESRVVEPCSLVEADDHKNLRVSDYSFNTLMSSLRSTVTGGENNYCATGHTSGDDQCKARHKQHNSISMVGKSHVIEGNSENHFGDCISLALPPVQILGNEGIETTLPRNNVSQVREEKISSSNGQHNPDVRTSQPAVIARCSTFQGELSLPFNSGISDGDVISNESFSHPTKPFDVLESLSVNTPVTMTGNFSSSHSTSPGACIMTTVANRFQQTVMLDSVQTEQNLLQSTMFLSRPTNSQTSTVMNCTIDSNLYQSNTEDGNNITHPFKDALASSSGSDSETDK